MVARKHRAVGVRNGEKRAFAVARVHANRVPIRTRLVQTPPTTDVAFAERALQRDFQRHASKIQAQSTPPGDAVPTRPERAPATTVRRFQRAHADRRRAARFARKRQFERVALGPRVVRRRDGAPQVEFYPALNLALSRSAASAARGRRARRRAGGALAQARFLFDVFAHDGVVDVDHGRWNVRTRGRCTVGFYSWASSQNADAPRTLSMSSGKRNGEYSSNAAPCGPLPRSEHPGQRVNPGLNRIWNPDDSLST